MAITSTGVGSGLDINGLVNQLMALERRPLTALAQKEAEFQGKLTAYGTLKSALAGFQGAVQGLNSLAKFQAFKASSADTTIFTATGSASAVAGSYAVEVKQLAQSHKLASKAFTNVTDTVGTGTLTIQFGTWDGASFTVNANKATQTVSIGAGAGSLAGVRDAINAAKIGVSASILNDGTGNKLVITSNDTGAANSLKITVSGDGDGNNLDDAGLSQLAYDPAGTLGNGKNLTQTTAAQNSTLKVDGIDNISKATNSISDVIQGITLNLVKTSAAGVATTLTVSQDTDAVKAAVQEFVNQHNALAAEFKELTAFDAETKTGGILLGDVTTLGMLAQIRRALNTPITGLRGPFTSLSDIGVSFQKDGMLALDSAKLQGAMDSNFKDIAGLFTAIGKPTDSLINFVSSTKLTAPGSYLVNISTLATQGNLNGASTAALADTNGTFNTPFAIDANNDTLSVKLNGVDASTITLAQGSYTTAAALTAEIQSKINGDATLKAAGIAATVSFDGTNDRLVISSNAYGTGSTVEVTAIDTTTASTLGFSVATGSAGVNVAGTINGAAATGSGRLLTGASGTDVDGLTLEVTGGATGSRGTVDFSRGYAVVLDNLIESLLAANGPINSRTDGIQRSIDDVTSRTEALNRRLEGVEQRFRDQFNALDNLLARLRTTSDFLTRQLALLPGSLRENDRTRTS